MRKSILFLLVCLGLVLSGTGLAQENQIEKAKIFQEDYPLITESDLYCSVYIADGPLSDLKIIGAERQEEKILHSDADTLYINKGTADGLEIGQMFLVIDIGPQLGDYGRLATRTGRVRIVRLEENRGVVRVDRTCGEVSLGGVLVPFEEKEGLLGKDEGYTQEGGASGGTSGSVVYLAANTHIGGTGQWAVIDVGLEQGVRVGQQMTIFKRVKNDLPREAIGSLIVIDVQPKTSTVKLLSCRDSVEIGFQVQAK
jgi:hypothetical protein